MALSKNLEVRVDGELKLLDGIYYHLPERVNFLKDELQLPENIVPLGVVSTDIAARWNQSAMVSATIEIQDVDGS